MTTKGIVTMVLVLAFVWGGFALFVMTAVRKERKKQAGDA
ncbi:MAG: MetS family NSS transporter small subunit [marine benthic group bacterium]|nr:MetS family NSS transporter small subunit [Gemmatimonadota bacterium]